jgi:hypothetical protein
LNQSDAARKSVVIGCDAARTQEDPSTPLKHLYSPTVSLSLLPPSSPSLSIIRTTQHIHSRSKHPPSVNTSRLQYSRAVDLLEINSTFPPSLITQNPQNASTDTPRRHHNSLLHHPLPSPHVTHLLPPQLSPPQQYQHSLVLANGRHCKTSFRHKSGFTRDGYCEDESYYSCFDTGTCYYASFGE